MTALRETWATLLEALQAWSKDNVSRLAAALAYYSLLALAPLLIIGVSVTGWVVGATAARGRLASELSKVIGIETASGVQALLANAQSPSAGLLSGIVGSAIVLLGASGVFLELRAALNTVWDVPSRPGSALRTELRERLWSLLMVLGAAIVLLCLLLAEVVTSALYSALNQPPLGGELALQTLNFLISFVVLAGLLALTFKYVPDVIIEWRDARTGAWMTAFLFTVGKTLLGLYLGKAAVGSAYGAAGSLIVLVVWVYYSAHVLFLGAEFTQAHARRRGHALVPRGEQARTAQLAVANPPTATPGQ
jgi:membrane protein